MNKKAAVQVIRHVEVLRELSNPVLPWEEVGDATGRKRAMPCDGTRHEDDISLGRSDCWGRSRSGSSPRSPYSSPAPLKSSFNTASGELRWGRAPWQHLPHLLERDTTNSDLLQSPVRYRSPANTLLFSSPAHPGPLARTKVWNHGTVTASWRGCRCYLTKHSPRMWRFWTFRPCSLPWQALAMALCRQLQRASAVRLHLCP